MRLHAIAAAACLCACALAAGARAELYTWTDERGQVHVTDDATRVPQGKPVTVEPTRRRAATAREIAEPKTARDITTPSAKAPELETGMPQRPAVTSALSLSRARPERTHLLHFQRAGRDISLNVSLDDRVECDFKADTGASLNTIPRWAVEALGVEIDEDTPRISLVGVSGQPMLAPVIVIPSVRIGTVYVENVEMAVLDTMRSGLLGMPFFNHFKVQIDPGQGELRLIEVDLDSVEGVYGGVGEEIWRERFREIHARLAALEKARDSVPAESETQAQNYLDRLDREEQKLQTQLDELEDRAQAAGVPANWR